MSELFKVIRRLDLADHMSRHAEIERVGQTLRANPCPVCNHNDCCTVYPKDNTFSCFSCDSGGDIINFQRILAGHDSNLAAAKDLAAQYHIDPDQPRLPEKYQTKQEKPKKAPAPAADAPQAAVISRERAEKLRRLAAETFHDALARNPDATRYQITKRGHSWDTLQKHLVGISTPAVIKQATKAGYTKEELCAVGLMRRYGKSYGQYIPTGHYVYPHFSGDRILHFTIKDPTKEKKFQLRRAAADTDWIMYGQDALENEEVWLVEGEDDRLTLLENGEDSVCATIGNSNTARILDWIGANAKGKTFYLAFDPDDAGKKYAAKHGTTIYNSGGRALVIDLSWYQDDIDGVIRSAVKAGEKPGALLKKLKDSATEVNLDEDGNEYYSFGSFEVLGELADGSIAFWSTVHRRTYTFGIKELGLDELVQIGSNEVRSRVSRTQKADKILFRSLKTYLIVEAGHKYLGSLQLLGQGIHLLYDDRLLINNGDEAVIWDGNDFTVQDYPLIERQRIVKDQDLKWINLEKVMQKARTMTPDMAEEIFNELLNLIMGWKLTAVMENVLLTGWLCAQVVQTAWEWRPQLWLSGASGSGKTLLTQLVESLGGNLTHLFQGNIVTEPGFRQILSNHAFLPIIDEFEKSDHRDRIIERLRSAGRGGKGVVGSATQEAVVSRIRHMVLIASIETGLVRAAEQYRYLQVSTQKDNTVSPTIPPPSELERLQINMVAFSLWAVNRAKKLLRNMPTIPGYDNRWIHSVAVPLSMMAAFDEEPDKCLQELVKDYLSLWSQYGEGEVLEDETALLQDILLAAIRIPDMQGGEGGESAKTIYVERSIAQILSAPLLNDEYHKTTQTYGIRLLHNNDLFIYPETVGKKLLRNTRWRDLNIRDILRRLPGAQRAKKYIAGTQVRGMVIPHDTWKSEGEHDENE